MATCHVARRCKQSIIVPPDVLQACHRTLKDPREKVVTLKQSGMKLSNISREVDRSKSVISRILKLYDDKKKFVPASKLGRLCKITQRDDGVMKRYLDKDPFATAAEISQKLKTDLGKHVSCYTVSRRLNEMVLKFCSSTTKPLISKKSNAARLIYTERHVLCSDSDWDKVHFSDESKFNLVGSDGRQYVRERVNPKCVKKSVKFGGGSVMVWGMFSSEGLGPIIRIKEQ